MTVSLPKDVAGALSQPGVRERLGAFARDLYYQHTVSSTNDLAREAARQGAPEGTTFLAAAQTSGRGRRGRQWFSPAESGLYTSIVLRGTDDPKVTLLAGVAAAEGIHDVTGLPAELEWPNDVVISEPRHDGDCRRSKVGGILCEGYHESGEAPAVVVGIGINLVSVDYPADIAGRATDLERQLGRRVDRGTLLVACLLSLAVWRERHAVGDGAAVLARWRELSPSSDGELVRWATRDRTRVGRTAGIDDDGALLVRTEDRMERIVGGTLDWLGR